MVEMYDVCISYALDGMNFLDFNLSVSPQSSSSGHQYISDGKRLLLKLFWIHVDFLTWSTSIPLFWWHHSQSHYTLHTKTDVTYMYDNCLSITLPGVHQFSKSFTDKFSSQLAVNW